MSRAKCSFRKCELSKSSNPEIHFFTFPVKDKERFVNLKMKNDKIKAVD